MDKKTLPAYMLLTRDAPQNKRLTQTESEVLQKNIPSNWTGKKDGVAILISDKIDFKKIHKKKPERQSMILKGRTHQEDICYLKFTLHFTDFIFILELLKSEIYFSHICRVSIEFLKNILFIYFREYKGGREKHMYKGKNWQ